MIDLNFPKQPSVGFIKNGPKERKYSVSGISLGGNTLLMPEGRGEWLKLWADNSNSNANNQVCRRASLNRQKTTPLLSDKNRKLRHLVWKKHENNPRHKAHMSQNVFSHITTSSLHSNGLCSQQSQSSRAAYDVVEQEISIVDVQQRNLQQLCNVVMSMFAAPC